MSTLTKQFTFVADTDAEAAKVNINFDDIIAFINQYVVHTDGSKPMTGALELPSADPTTANQAARKAYVDAAANIKHAGFSGSAPVVGPAVSASTALRMVGGYNEGITTSIGQLAVFFPSGAFSSTVQTITLTVARQATGVDYRFLNVAVADPATNGFIAKFSDSRDGTDINGGLVAVTWMALGV